MAQALVNIRMDEILKKDLEDTCRELGMNITTAITIYAKKLTREKRIPFEVSVDPFYSKKNQRRLDEAITQLEEGRGIERDIIEVYDGVDDE